MRQMANFISWTEPGIHTLSWQDSGGENTNTRFFAVNLISESEGNIQVREEIIIGQDRSEGLSDGEGAYTPLWPWAVGVGLAILMLEWWIYHRKVMI